MNLLKLLGLNDDHGFIKEMSDGRKNERAEECAEKILAVFDEERDYTRRHLSETLLNTMVGRGFDWYDRSHHTRMVEVAVELADMLDAKLKERKCKDYGEEATEKA